MKKVLRILGLIVMVPLFLYWIFLGIFLASEYFKGNTYVDYLNENKTLLDEEFEMPDDFYTKQLYMVGEIHGFKKSPEIDFKLFKHLNERIGVRNYMAEVDYSQAHFLNTYLKTGNDSLVHFALKNWVVIQARGNRDYYQKWKNLYELNQTLPEGKKINVLGCDVLTDKAVLLHHLREILNHKDYDGLVGQKSELKNLIENIKTLKKDSLSFTDFRNRNEKHWNDIKHLFVTILQTEKGGREGKIFENFETLYRMNQLESEKIYSFYGNFHAFQAATADGSFPLGARIKNSDLEVGKNMVSMNMCFQDSKMIMPSEGLPFFLQTGPEWSEVGFKYDSLLLFYLEGIMDLERTSEPNTVTIYNMNRPNNPYADTNRLMNIKMILPFLENQKIEIQEGLGVNDYSQYLIFVRNSEAARPL